MKPLYPLFKKGKTVYDIVGFDVETKHRKITYNKNKKHLKEVTGDLNDFYIGGLVSNDEDYIHFKDKHEMIKEVLSKKYNNKIIVATNLGFDFNALFFKTKYWSKFKIIYSGSKLLSAIYEIDENTKIVFMDTSNFIPLSVAQMGDILKIPKLKKPSCLGKLPKNDEELKELLIYNKRDCVISKEFLELMQKTINMLGGQLKMTIASSSMDLYRRKYHRFILQHETKILDDETYYDFLFNAYYGGRTEAFSRGKVGRAKVYDINSLYPSVMLKSYPHPKSVRKIDNPTVDMLDYYLKFKGVMKVKVTSPEYMKYPYLPHKYKVKGGTKLIFPLGTWTGTYTNFELNRAVELGYKINRIDKAYIYRGSYFPFREFVEDLYALRLKFKAEKSPLEIGVKLLMNSLYGKFGQRKVVDVNFLDLDEMDEKETQDFMFNSERKINMSDGKLCIESIEKECDSSFVFPILPIYTTAYARDELYNYIVENNALYCDTDSILTFQTLPEEKELGKMKVEYDVLNGVIIKPKMYMYEIPNKKIINDLKDGKHFSIVDEEITKHITRMKGVSRVNKNKFIDVLNGKTISYMKFTKTKESVRRGFYPNTIINMIKSIDLEDNKRIWKNKFNPLVMEESIPLTIND